MGRFFAILWCVDNPWHWNNNQKSAITFAARRHNVNVLLRDSPFLLFAVLVVWCRPCRR